MIVARNLGNIKSMLKENNIHYSFEHCEWEISLSFQINDNSFYIEYFSADQFEYTMKYGKYSKMGTAQSEDEVIKILTEYL